jgi:hypothetical protein
MQHVLKSAAGIARAEIVATELFGDMREDVRFICDALRLFRVCRNARCARAQACRGDPFGCYARASVPKPAKDGVSALLLAERMPWLPLLARGNASEQLAYECWIAGLEAGARRRD